MNLFICVDDNGGMLFNNRRQSRDRAICDMITEISRGSRLFMSGYSAKLFPQEDNIIVCENFFDLAQDGDFCFAEQAVNSLDKVKALYIFRWNRVYPADVAFGFCPEEEGFLKEHTRQFRGTSHEITLDVYRRK